MRKNNFIKYRMADNLNYITSVMAIFSIVGVLIKLFMGDSQGSATAAVYGYGLVTVSLLCIMFIDFSLAQNKLLNSNTLSFVLKLFQSSIPTLATIGLLGWLITLNIIYYQRINDDDVAKEFSKYSFVSTVLILLQIVLIFQFVNTKKKVLGGETKSNPFGPIVYVLSLINAIFITILTIILKFYSTDG